MIAQQESEVSPLDIPEVEKISPDDSSTLNPGGIEFLWNTINSSSLNPGSGFITYAIEVHKLQDNSWFLLKRRVVSPQAGKTKVAFTFAIPEGIYKWTVRAIYGMFVKNSRPKLIPGPPGDYYNFSAEITENENQQEQSNDQQEIQLAKINIQKSYNKCIAENWSIPSQMDYLKTIAEAIDVYDRIIPNDIETKKIKQMWNQTENYVLDHCKQRTQSMKQFCVNNNWTLKIQKDYYSLLNTVFEVYLELIPQDKRTTLLKYRLKKISREMKRLLATEKKSANISLKSPVIPRQSKFIPPILPKPAIAIPNF